VSLTDTYCFLFPHPAIFIVTDSSRNWQTIATKLPNAAGMFLSRSQFKNCWLTICFVAGFGSACLNATQAAADNSAPALAKAELSGTYTLPRISLSEMGNPLITEAVLQRAQKDGFKYTDLISIGSGLEKGRANEFFGIADRGPNSHLEVSAYSDTERRVLPIPAIRAKPAR